MRKQTKVVAVASAAALLAIGGAMTSFAAQGWVEEDGTWYYYDKDGNRVENEWRKSGDGWYYLDSEEGGAMATDKIIEDDDNTYYVDATGVMVKNTWVKVVNEEQDDDDLAEYHYYYMQSNGKAIKAPSSGKTTFKTIDGKRYAFDDDGIMLWGWVNDQSERQSEDDGWEDAVYYLGSWEDGSMKTGWQKITVYDDKDDKDDDYDYWFNFKSNGKKRTHADDKKDATWKSGGKRYHFDNRGVMVYEWYNVSTSDRVLKASSASAWRYFNSPEDGARVSKGWFKVVAPALDSDNAFLNYADDKSFALGDANDEEERWYYADKDGVLKSGEITKINGKYYGFYPGEENEAETTKAARALAGLNQIDVVDGKVTTVYDDSLDADELDTLLDTNVESDDIDGDLYYFGSKDDIDTDAVMKTGNVTVTLDGESYNFYFQKTGTPASGKGKGVTGIDDKKYIYIKGMRIKADSDDKYQLVNVEPSADGDDINAETAPNVTKLDAPKTSATYTYVNKDNETVRVWVMNDATQKYLVNTSGNIQKSKTSGVKDGNDCYYYVDKDRHVILYTDNKVLKTASSNNQITVEGNTLADLVKGLEDAYNTTINYAE